MIHPWANGCPDVHGQDLHPVFVFLRYDTDILIAHMEYNELNMYTVYVENNLVVKHGNGKSSIHGKCFIFNANLQAGFPLPCLITRGYLGL
jgi:hypothetical protein